MSKKKKLNLIPWSSRVSDDLSKQEAEADKGVDPDGMIKISLVGFLTVIKNLFKK